jgi:hypothetical protein
VSSRTSGEKAKWMPRIVAPRDEPTVGTEHTWYGSVRSVANRVQMNFL